VGIAGRNHDPTNPDDRADDDLLSIEGILGPILLKEISTEGCQNLKDTLQYLDKPILDTNERRLGLTQSRFDDGVRNSQGTRGRDISYPL
jgi:hypothetical protein